MDMPIQIPMLAISAPFAPAYFFLGIGAEYLIKKKNLNFIYLL